MSTEPRCEMTLRDLLRRVQEEAARPGVDLDMPVVLRVEDDDGHHAGGLYDVEVDAGCGDEDALILDGAQDVVPAGGTPGVTSGRRR